MWSIMVGCPNQTILWLILETTLHQKPLASGFHLESELLTSYVTAFSQTLAHFRDHTINQVPGRGPTVPAAMGLSVVKNGNRLCKSYIVCTS